MTLSLARLILRISQAHVAPGMSLAKWEAIVSKHGLRLTNDPLAIAAVSDAGVQAMAEEIAAVVRGAK